jgi:pimeloyl-ACP methyl ester carboxylesterase
MMEAAASASVLSLVGSYALFVFAVVIAVRFVQRLYYISRGHSHKSLLYGPRQATSEFFRTNGIPVKECSTRSVIDRTPLFYKRIGTGSKIIVHSNGVGTDFFIWLPMMQHVLRCDPAFFDKYTIIALAHRGLFVSDGDGPSRVNITLRNCASDVVDVLKHAGKITPCHLNCLQSTSASCIIHCHCYTGVKKCDAIIGWSTGAQVALACSSLYPASFTSLFLFNVSLGNTLHSVFQPISPLPLAFQKPLSKVLKLAIVKIRPVVESAVWDFLRTVAHSVQFRVLFEILSFFNGFPPEQAAYFHEYTKDIFTSRAHTHALLDLIHMVDEPLPSEDLRRSLAGVRNCLLISGYFDFITGVYHSDELHAVLASRPEETAGNAPERNVRERAGPGGVRRSKHVQFSMGSHFLLLEWPDLVAHELVAFMEALDVEEAAPVTPKAVKQRKGVKSAASPAENVGTGGKDRVRTKSMR